jgi:fatty-acyl-CoA synthase
VNGPDRSPSLNVGGWISAWAERAPERIAIVETASGARLSYAELDALSRHAAALLASEGVRQGDRVAVALRSEALYAALYFAVSKLGAVLLPLNTRLARPEIAYQLSDAQPSVVIHDASIDVPEAPGARVWERDALLAALPAAATAAPLAGGGEDPHVLMYTSGTTGYPKGALLPHRKTLYNTLNAELYFGLGEGDVVVAPVPLFHSFGLKILAVPTLFAGATLVLVERFDAREIQEIVRAERATLLGGVPIMFRRMLREGLSRASLASLRSAFSAGAALDLETIRAFGEAGIPLRQGYGQTETSILCCLDAADAQHKAGSVGRAVAHTELRIADEHGRALQSGATGEIQVRGPVCMLGYWRAPEATGAARIDGWHRTGDLGTIDADGFVYLVGRLKDMYISGGENVYPAEVERVLEQHPGVAEAAVVGVADREWGEVGRAYVVPARESLGVDELERWADAQLARYKRPRQWVLVAELPRTASGKVRKHLLAGRDVP